jgi:GNAT superfamily N-acetyltransferase
MYEIYFNPRKSRRVARYVTLGSFSARELPIAIWRMVLTRDFIFSAGIPALILFFGKIIHGSLSLEKTGMLIMGIAVIWLLAALVWILRFGKTYGIGCDFSGENPEKKTLVGGLRFKFAKRKRIIRIAGILVDSQHRKKGIFTALLLALFRMAIQEAQKEGSKNRSPMRISIFAPGHPASRRVVHTYFHDRQTLILELDKENIFAKSLKRLELEVEAMNERGVQFTFSIQSSNGRLLS